MLGKLVNGILGNASSVSKEELQKEFEILLANDELIQAGFVLIRDMFIFTNKRLILVDKQGFTGKKVEYLSVGYKSISRFSIETTGSFDLDAELRIWISAEREPSIIKEFNKNVNIYEVQKILAENVL